MSPAFQLIGLHHHGQALDWQWEGSDAQAQTPLSQVLQSLDALSPLVRAHIHALQLQRQSGVQDDTWWLYGDAGQWVCTVNDKALPMQQTVRLNDGDVIEIGFVRLQVRLHSAAPQPSVADPVPGSAPDASAASDTATNAFRNFELTDLALGDTHNPLTQDLQKPDDDISDLIGDSLADPVLQTQTPTAIIGSVGQGAAPLVADMVDDDPLASLHSAYLRRLRSPLYTDPQEQWQSTQRAERTQWQDPFEHLKNEAGSEPDLSDLLKQTQDINITMDSFDQLSAVDILAPEPFDSLMHLFAPEELKPPPPSQATDKDLLHPDPVLPGLTRREHHSLSLDSAMPIQKAQP